MDPNTLGARVRARRDELGLTQQELAKAVGVSQVAIKKIESGGNTRHGRLLAEALGTSIEWLETGAEGGEVRAPASPPRAWPFARIPEDQVRALRPDDIARLEGVLAAAIHNLQIPVKVAPKSHEAPPAPANELDTLGFPYSEPGKAAAPPAKPAGAQSRALDAVESPFVSTSAPMAPLAGRGFASNDDDYVAVPEMSVRMAAGLGIENYEEAQIGEYLLPRSLLESFGVPLEQMCIVYGHGDSMQPAIWHGKPVLFLRQPLHDLREVRSRVIYGINRGGKMIVKCIARGLGGQWVARSLNQDPQYADFPLQGDDGGETRVVGRVLLSLADLSGGVDSRLLRR